MGIRQAGRASVTCPSKAAALPFLNENGKGQRTVRGLSNGTAISLRDRALKKVGSYDILTEAGKVKPKAITNPETYQSPNGASLRPNTPTQQDLVDSFKGPSVVVYAVLQGTMLPEGLVVVHEKADHYSLQPAEEMSLAELNAKINNFLNTKGVRLTKSEWQEKYPKATETS